VNGLIYYVAAGILWTGLAAQLPDLWRHWRDPLKQSFCAVIFFSGLSFLLGAPPTVALVNSLVGIPNVAAPLTYGAVTAFSVASLILIVHWRGTDPVRVRRVSRAWLFSCGAVITVLGILFALGDTPVERREDFDTYYASTPYVREMIVLYLATHMVAAVTTTLLCWRWTQQVKRWTRASLALLVLGWLFTSAYSVLKFVSLTAHWLGHRWDSLSTSVAPLIAVGACLASAGYILPVVGPPIDSAIVFVRLRPLFRLLAGPTGGQRSVTPLPWPAIGDVGLQLTARETAIRDGLKRLAGQLDDQVRQRAYRQALAAGSCTADAEVIGMAAMVAVAALNRAPSPLAEASTAGITLGDIDVVMSMSSFIRRSAAGTWTLDLGQSSLLSLSRALRTPIVDAAVRSRRTAGAGAVALSGGRALAAGVPTSQRFDLSDASDELFREIWLQEDRMLQSFSFDNTNKHLYTVNLVRAGRRLPGETRTYTSTERSAQGDLCVTRLDWSGNIIGRMHLLGFGHGVSIAVEPSGNSAYLWTETEAGTPDSYGDAYGSKIARFKFANGAVLTKNSSALTKYSPVAGSTKTTVAIDPVNNRLAHRYNLSDTWKYSLYDLTAFKAGTFTALATVTQPTGLGTFQGYTTLGQYLYLLDGTAYSSTNTAPGNTSQTIVNWNTGTQVDRRLTSAASSLSYREPEGLAIQIPDTADLTKVRLVTGFASRADNDAPKQASFYYKDKLI
jgi:hypothetical protein